MTKRTDVTKRTGVTKSAEATKPFLTLLGDLSAVACTDDSCDVPAVVLAPESEH